MARAKPFTPYDFDILIRKCYELKELTMLGWTTPDISASILKYTDFFALEWVGKVKPETALVMENKIFTYDWSQMNWGHPIGSEFGDSLDMIEKTTTSDEEFYAFLIPNTISRFQEPSDKLNDKYSLENFVMKQNVSRGNRRVLIIFLETIGTIFPSNVDCYIKPIAEGLPSEEELSGIIRMEMADLLLDGLLSDEDLGKITRAVKGFSLTAAQDSVRLRLQAGDYPDIDGLIDILQRDKEKYISSALGFEVLHKPAAIPYGMDYLLDHFNKWLKTGSIGGSGQDSIKGILLMGPGGTGKTFFARYCSDLIGLPGVMLDVSSIYNKYVGESEKAVRRMVTVLNDMKPCVLFIDEISRALSITGSSGGDSGVSQRVLGIFLDFLQDKAQNIFVVAACNELNFDDPATSVFTRSGRFSTRFWVDVPCCAARQQILEYNFRKRDSILEEAVLAQMANDTNYLSGADIEELVAAVERDRRYYNCPAGSEEHMAVFNKALEIYRRKAWSMYRAFEIQRGRALSEGFIMAGPPPED